ncbi:hypothetical protein ACU21_06775 [Actinobaculum suis]|nr:hypothetical protein ACU19_07805 [Actinobaculum suis]OCA93946.1 hypothetical protein ACU20_07390 [Actinobaculum suis]OCA94411.1 hypothetical protein ACU21_06775 [Actinobaculum suis]
MSCLHFTALAPFFQVQNANFGKSLRASPLIGVSPYLLWIKNSETFVRFASQSGRGIGYRDKMEEFSSAPH